MTDDLKVNQKTEATLTEVVPPLPPAEVVSRCCHRQRKTTNGYLVARRTFSSQSDIK